MSTPTQDQRPLAISTPLGKDHLLLVKLHLREELSRPFTMDLELQSIHGDINPEDLLGQRVHVTIKLPSGGLRHVDGFVWEFASTGFVSPLFAYSMRVVPWLQMLALGSDCRLFQGLTRAEVAEQVCRSVGYSGLALNLNQEYPKRSLCVQYRETHLHFFNRLLEQEGIFYYFEHTPSAHTVVLVDSNTNLEAAPGYESLPYGKKAAGVTHREHLTEWKSQSSVHTRMHTLSDYDYVRPKLDLVCSAAATGILAPGAHEHFEYPGGYELTAHGEFYANLRQEEANCHAHTVSGSAVALGLSPGHTFTAQNLPHESQNADYLLTHTELHARVADYHTRVHPGPEFDFSVKFSAIPASIPYRPQRHSVRPIIPGVQTALVVGPAGADPQVPHVSSMGSVKLLFPWDRQSRASGESSPWVRVSQISAGRTHGSMFCPRIGDEVLVAFEEGDPDRPVVVGRLYNADNMPSLPLPDFARRSYIHDDGGNAICFTPDDGHQSISIYSPYSDTMHVVGASYEDTTILTPGSPPPL